MANKVTRVEQVAKDRAAMESARAQAGLQAARELAQRQQAHHAAQMKSDAALMRNIPSAPRYAVKQIGERRPSLETQTTAADKPAPPRG